MTEAELGSLAAWYRREYRRRTEALLDGEINIDWLVPEYRVTRTEIQQHAEAVGICMDVNDWVELFHFINNRKERENA